MPVILGIFYALNALSHDNENQSHQPFTKSEADDYYVNASGDKNFEDIFTLVGYNESIAKRDEINADVEEFECD